MQIFQSNDEWVICWKCFLIRTILIEDISKSNIDQNQETNDRDENNSDSEDDIDIPQLDHFFGQIDPTNPSYTDLHK